MTTLIFFIFNPVIPPKLWEQFHGPWEQPTLPQPADSIRNTGNSNKLIRVPLILFGTQAIRKN